MWMKETSWQDVSSLGHQCERPRKNMLLRKRSEEPISGARGFDLGKLLWTCRRSSCVSRMRVSCTSSGLRITRSCGQATRAQPGARQALSSVSETPSKRFLASQMVWYQEHCRSASLCQTTVDVDLDGADERSCVVSCASGAPISEDPAVWTYVTNDSLIDDGLPTGEPQACANLSLGASREVCPVKRAPSLAFRATLPATCAMLFSSISTL